MTKDVQSAIAGLLTRDLDPGGEAIDAAVLYRELTLDRAGLDEDKRTIPASLSSETEIKRFFGREMLVHTAAAVNLERAGGGLPLLFGHNQDQPIGLVDDVRIDGDRLRGTLRFSENTRANEIWNDVRGGFLKNISIGYRIEKWEENDDDDLIRATRWTPFEASVVSVPADHTVGIGRSDPALAAAALAAGKPGAVVWTRDGDGDPPVNVVELKQVRDQALREGEANAKKDLVKRIGEINELFVPFLQRGPTFIALRDQLVMKGSTVEQARTALYQLFAGEPEPLAGDLEQAEGSANGAGEQIRSVETPQGRRREVISGGQDSIEKFRDGLTFALEIRAADQLDYKGLDAEKVAKARRENEFLSMTPVEMARAYLGLVGVPFAGLSRDRIVGLALNTRGLISHSTSDFANILEDVSNKSLQIGYNEAPETWNIWCRAGTLPDFKQGNRPNLSAFGDLDIVYENGEYKYGSFQDLKEVLTLATYGKLFSISRQALVNDDLDALSRIPASMGRAAARKIGDLAYNVLINGLVNTLNQDSIELFDAATHGNYTASGGAPTVASIEVARTGMATQTDPSGEAVLNIRPAFLLCPIALEGTSKVLQVGQYDPAGTAGTLTPNTVQGTFQVVADARLDADSAVKWYMAASPNVVETVEVAFLEGQQSPFMETQNGWSVDGAAYKVRIDAVAAPLDFRGMYLNAGA